MKAIVQREYGPADALRLEEVPRPIVGPREVLVRVRAASVNRGDWHLLHGVPYLVRLLGFGLLRPRQAVPGQYAAGIVAAIGDGVTRLQPGDAVYGSCKGAFAEFVRASEDSFAPKPGNLTFEQAAALPHGGLAALQALRDAGRVRGGQQILVLGASGAVGTMAVQIAKALGAVVSAVCGAARMESVRGLGADRVLDRARHDLADDVGRYDLILDTAGDQALGRLRQALIPGGRVVMIAGGDGRWLGGMDRVLRAVLWSLGSRKKLVPFLAVPRQQDLVELTDLVEHDQLSLVVDSSLPLARTADAFRQLESRTANGAIVVTP